MYSFWGTGSFSLKYVLLVWELLCVRSFWLFQLKLELYNLGHVCETPGCRNVIVVDGNMKNARQVCACRDVGELHFTGMNGSITVGKCL